MTEAVVKNVSYTEGKLDIKLKDGQVVSGAVCVCVCLQQAAELVYTLLKLCVCVCVWSCCR